ncbi:hypothetical protein [Candidatus Palauibacter sp.]|uniref:hypothetical protein n=1 Tax=Candidatus Palauibacter sp. TaxID=3101350 RepID=UPI003B52A438
MSVEAVGVAGTRRPLDRARTILGNWTIADAALRPVHPSGTIAAARREAARVENAIRGMDDPTVEELGGLNGYLRRLVEMRNLLRSAHPEGVIDGHSVWRSSRLSGVQT